MFIALDFFGGGWALKRLLIKPELLSTDTSVILIVLIRDVKSLLLIKVSGGLEERSNGCVW